MLGATLGAGVGALQGLHGLLIDSLESVDLVTASGKLVTASEKENEDLFWGIRGAGYNFGIVTSATYRIYDATNQGQVVNADFLFSASQNRSVWEMLQSYDTTLPPELGLTVFVLPNGTSREVSLSSPEIGLSMGSQFLMQVSVALDCSECHLFRPHGTGHAASCPPHGYSSTASQHFNDPLE